MEESLVNPNEGALPRTESDIAASEEWIQVQYEELGPGLRRYLTRWLGSACAAEDLVQETFLRLFEEVRRGSRIKNLRSWIFQVGHNLAVDTLRRQGLEDRAVDAAVESLPRQIPPSGEAQLLHEERNRRVQTALALLSSQERQCLELRAEGLRYREIAEVMGLHISTVTTFVLRAVRKIARQVHD